MGRPVLVLYGLLLSTAKQKTVVNINNNEGVLIMNRKHTFSINPVCTVSSRLVIGGCY